MRDPKRTKDKSKGGFRTRQIQSRSAEHNRRDDPQSRTYRDVSLQTTNWLTYLSPKLIDRAGRLIKQPLFKFETADKIATIIKAAPGNQEATP